MDTPDTPTQPVEPTAEPALKGDNVGDDMLTVAQWITDRYDPDDVRVTQALLIIEGIDGDGDMQITSATSQTAIWEMIGMLEFRLAQLRAQINTYATAAYFDGDDE
jgi:hypothetical protein